MKSLGDRILALLDDPRVEVRCAAALVLGAAGKGNAAVGRALGEKLSDDNPMMKRFVLDGLEAMGARGLAKDLAPLLGSDDDEVRARAARLLGAQGAGAEAAVRRQLREGNAAARRAAAALLVHMGTAAALDALYEHLADPEAGEAILQRLRAELDKKDPKVHRTYLARAVAGVKKLSRRARGAKADPDAAARLGALLRLVGYLADPSTLGLLVEHGAADRPHGVRVAAIAGLRRIVAGGASAAARTEGAITALLGWADDADPAVARASVDTLRGARIPEGVSKKLAALAKAKNPDARRLAMERMAAVGSSAIATLLANLEGGDPGARDAAARALSAAPEAAGPLAEALAKATSVERARRLASALRGHEGRVPEPALEALEQAAQRAIEQHGDPVGSVVLDTHARVAPAAHAALLFAHAAKLARAGKHHDAFAALRPLAHLGVALSDEQRLALGVLGLKAGGKDLLRAARTVDPVLQQFAQLLGTGYPLAKALLKRKDLELDELFTLGFNFVESTDEDEKDFGRTLLDAVIERQPRGKLATAAKNKLKLSVHED